MQQDVHIQDIHVPNATAQVHDQGSGHLTLHMQGDLDEHNAAELSQVLLPVVKDARLVELDLSQVASVRGQGVAVIVRLVAAATAHHERLAIHQAEPAIRSRLHQLGLDQFVQYTDSAS
ncbi:STAS domain-containing protein [Streptomyces sp. NPDC020096]